MREINTQPSSHLPCWWPWIASSCLLWGARGAPPHAPRARTRDLRGLPRRPAHEPHPECTPNGTRDGPRKGVGTSAIQEGGR